MLKDKINMRSDILTHTKLCPAGSSERSSSSEKLVVLGGSMMCITSALEESSVCAASISNRNKVSPYRSTGPCHDNVLPINVTTSIALGANRKNTIYSNSVYTGAHNESPMNILLCTLIMCPGKD